LVGKGIRGCSKNIANIPCHLKVASRTSETLRPCGLRVTEKERPQGDKKRGTLRRPFADAQGDKKESSGRQKERSQGDKKKVASERQKRGRSFALRKIGGKDFSNNLRVFLGNSS